MVIFPKNKFQKFVSYAFERSMPTLQYFIWNPMTYHARKSGWTEQEKLYHNFWRGDFMIYHSYAQSMHPLAYNERQRADQFFRRLEDVLPGIEAPEWAQQHRRGVDFDFDGMMNPYRAMETVYQESTPKTHYGTTYPSAISHVGNYRFLLGVWAQRLFFNEDIKGNLKDGYYTEEQKKNLNSWYSTAEDFNKLNNLSRTKEQIEEDNKNIEKWIKNFDTFYPEYKNYKVNAAPAKFREPYFERTVEDIANSIFISKWMNALEKKVFSSNEIQQIYEFFIHQRDDVFWNQSEEDGLFKPTELYNKFIKELNLPNVFQLEKYTSKVVEEQYKDLQQINYGINFTTVETFKRQHLKFLSEVTDKNISSTDLKQIRSFITEEVYNPLFRQKVAQFAKGAQGSYVVAAYKANGTSALKELETLHAQTKDELHFINRENHNAYVSRLRNVVKTFPFNATPVPEVRF